jgi:MEDS: MEthanogen/methylotroph, DcmR Sensory domain/Histidine kinase-like ATPase domain
MAVDGQDISVASGDHVVQFYEDDLQLGRMAGAYLAAALEDGGVAIAIATEPHRRLFESELEAAGLDLLAASCDGSLILLDAAETMAGFVHAGDVDGDGFRRIVGSVVRQAAESGGPVRAYGEMVALLWDAGDVLAAIELEKAWNQLAAELPFALLCAYRSDTVDTQDLAGALREVCHLHTSVLGSSPTEQDPPLSGPKICAHFEAERHAPTAARHFAADVLGRWGHPSTLLEDAKLVVTELATNAVRHARSAFSVEIHPYGACVRVSVRDASRVRPIPRDNPQAPSGRGLRLIDAIAARWGAEIADDGKTVWAELRP